MCNIQPTPFIGGGDSSAEDIISLFLALEIIGLFLVEIDYVSSVNTFYSSKIL